jgi:sugar-specific transcriptional regulator TrmB
VSDKTQSPFPHGWMPLGEETLKKVLKDFGLTDSEVEVYLFISKYGALSGTDVARLIRKDKAQIFRTFKSLQKKGLVEATLEVPMRFAPVAFEKVLELTIKAKKDEAARIENTKEQLLDYWKDLNRKSLNVSLEKFVVIEGRHKVYSKISQMVAEAKSHVSAVSTFSGLFRAEQFGIFDTPTNESRHAVQFRLLTELSSQNVGAVKSLLKSVAKKGFNFKGKNPDLGLSVFPRMVIRDNEEAVFFITQRTSLSAEEDNLCLWTNCRDLVQAFTCVFEDLWQKASDVQDKIFEIEARKSTPKTLVLRDADAANRKHMEIMQSAKTEILVMTSSEGLIELSENLHLLKELAEKGVSIRIMAPIISENLQVVQQLSKCCGIKHVADSYLRTTVVDGQHLLQFKNPPSEREKHASALPLDNAFYTNNREYVENTERMLNELWKNSKEPSAVTLESILNFSKPSVAIPEENAVQYAHGALKKINAYNVAGEESISEKVILDRIINAKKYEVKSPSKDLTRVYGFSGQAVIHPPADFCLPDVMVHVFHYDKQSSYGAEDSMVVYLWLQTLKGFTYVPVAVVGDVAKGEAGFKALFAGTPAGQNVRILKKDELQVQMHGNTFFAGWTVTIPLFPTQNVLPPAAIMLEALGKLKTKAYAVTFPSGYKVRIEGNGFEAFVTFCHPSSKYSGPGTDGLINRDLIMTTTPP